MIAAELAALEAACRAEPTPARWAALALGRARAGRRREAARAADQAWRGPAPDPAVAALRRELLDGLAVRERGLTWCFVPGGPFVMGRDDGDPDEGPAHPVEVGDFWIAEVPMSWADWCEWAGWDPPPRSLPPDPELEAAGGDARFAVVEANKIRRQYCEDRTLRAVDWHAHVETPVEIFGRAPGMEEGRPLTYATKPVVAVAWQDAAEVLARASTGGITYRLPTEAEWEKAARGGKAGARYPLGKDTLAPGEADFDHFPAHAIQPSKGSPPNGYGLHAMAGTVWEWTADWYDAAAYAQGPRCDPAGPAQGQEKVIRGGSWADCAAACTVSFRASMAGASWKTGGFGWAMTPVVGIRPVRCAPPAP